MFDSILYTNTFNIVLDTITVVTIIIKNLDGFNFKSSSMSLTCRLKDFRKNFLVC